MRNALCGHLKGFTLIELLVVITVIAILAGLVAPAVFTSVGDAKVAAARTDIETLGLALDMYALHNDRYPTSAQGLQALMAPPTVAPAATNWRGPYIKKGVPQDPWGRPYLYQGSGSSNTTGYELSSLGRDGRPGGKGQDGDLRSWEMAQ